MEKEKALKSCPFCGSTGVIIDRINGQFGMVYWGHCKECRASSSVRLSEADAARAWNRRVCAGAAEGEGGSE